MSPSDPKSVSRPLETPVEPGGGDAERSREIRRMFSTVAPAYDRLNHVLSLSIDRLWRRRAARIALDGAPGGRRLDLLDVCAGTGDLAFALARRAGPRAGRVAAVDFSEAMLALLKTKALRRKALRIVAAQGDALRLPCSDGAFDVATMAFGLRNLTDRAAGVREMARVVRPGGRDVVLEFSMPRNRLVRAVYRRYLTRWLPLLGDCATGTRAYRYLAASVEDFPPAATTAQWFAQAGLVEVRQRPLSGGIATITSGVVQ